MQLPNLSPVRQNTCCSKLSEADLHLQVGQQGTKAAGGQGSGKLPWGTGS